MKTFNIDLSRLEFEYRIFVSLGIVLITFLVFILFFSDSDSIIVILGNYIGVPPNLSSKIYFSFLSLLMIGISLLRMWAGSILSAPRVMSFKIQDNILIQEGPYIIVRNPIYLSDLIAMSGFSFCFPLPGILLPILFYIHYIRLIQYEENSFSKKHNEEYLKYSIQIPRLLPTIKSISKFLRSNKNFKLNADGIRHNALYILFIPGFIVALVFNNFISAVLIGLPAVIDWAIVHTKIGYERNTTKSKKNKVFENILYAQCWEDPQIDRTALNIQRNDIVFSITSGGCNVLTFLIDNPKKIISLDLNPYQNYLIELKISCFQNLTYTELLEFIGIRNSSKRVLMYKNMKHSLSYACQEYWDQNLTKIKKGIIHCGRYEKYMALIGYLLRTVMGKGLIQNFYENEDPEIRKILFEKKWNNLRWKFLTNVILSRKMMTILFDKAFFKYFDETFSFGKHFAQKAKYALTKLPIKKNYFLAYILLGKYYDENNLPPYLSIENFDIIKSRVSRIQIVTGSCNKYFSDAPPSKITKFNFSNIFEWMSENEFENLLRQTVKAAESGAILCYRNLLVKRERPKILSSHIIPQKNLALNLHHKDLSFIYNNYVIEQIYKDEVKWNTELPQYQNQEN